WRAAHDCRLLAALGVCPVASALPYRDYHRESFRLRCLATRPRLSHCELYRAGRAAARDLVRLSVGLASTHQKNGRAGDRRCAMTFGTFSFFLLTFAGAFTPTADPAYFRNERTVSVAATDQQNYIVVDPEIWSHARPDLADLRVYNGTTQVPYVLTAQQSG